MTKQDNIEVLYVMMALENYIQYLRWKQSI